MGVTLYGRSFLTDGSHAQSAWILEPGKICVKSEEFTPEQGKPVVRSELMGISHGTEMLIYRGQLPLEIAADTSLCALRDSSAYPIKYGYANCGITSEGSHVFAYYPHQDLFQPNEDDLVELPRELNFEDAVFFANMETALTLAQDAGPRVGEVILIVGQGTVGLLTAEILNHSHLGKIITADRYALRREASSDIGCLSSTADPATVAETVKEVTGGRGCDIAIDCSGSELGLQLAIDSLGYSGKLVAGSCFGNRPLQLSLDWHFHRDRIRIISSQVSTIDPNLAGRWNIKRRRQQVLDLIDLIRPGRYITHRFTLSRVQEAFDLLDESPEQTIQVVLVPDWKENQ